MVGTVPDGLPPRSRRGELTRTCLHGIEHDVNPLLDIVRAPCMDWDKGNVAARQNHEVRALQDPNNGLFD